MTNSRLQSKETVSIPLITTGFTTILLIIALIIGFWLKSLSDNKELLSEMGNETLEMSLISQLIFTTHQQTMVIAALSTKNSADQQEKLYQQFIHNRSIIQDLNLKLSRSAMEDYEENIWCPTANLLEKFRDYETQAIDLYNKGNKQAAFEKLSQQAPREENHVMTALPHMLDGLLCESRN